MSQAEFVEPVQDNEEQEEEFSMEGEEEEASEKSVLLDVDNNFDTEGFKIPKGPMTPMSAPSLDGLSEEAIAKVLEGMSDNDIEDLFNKNTESFRCLAQALISRSSLMRHILYHFPPLEDPGIDEAFNFVEAEPTFDNVGAGKYKQLCKEMNIAPFSRVIRSLNSDKLNLKYYGFSDKQFKAIASCVMLNTHIQTLILEDNWISPEAALWLCEMLRENNSIKVLNLRECRLGPQGIANCVDGFSLNQSVREIDLSFNDLGDAGIQTLTEALKDNFNVDKINLGHNNLGELSGKLLGELIKDHANIDYLDLSWNDLYDGKALHYLLSGIAEGDGLEYLNLSWNGIGTPQTLEPVAKYLKSTTKLKHLDLSFNRLMGKLIGMLTAALKENMSLISINLGFNLITPADAITLVSSMREDKPLDYMDLQNVFVNKNFIPIWKRLTNMGKSVRIEGILDNYTIQGPDKRKILFDRCRYLAEKPKKVKLKKDFGSNFIYNLPDEIVDNTGLKKLIKKSKIKLDNDLIDALGEAFSPKKKKIELKLMRDSYLDYYPETQPPRPSRKSKGKKKKRKDAEEGDEYRPSTEEKGIGSDSLQLSSIQDESSLVTSRMNSNAPIRLSSHQQIGSHHDIEKVMSNVIFDGASQKSSHSSLKQTRSAVRASAKSSKTPSRASILIKEPSKGSRSKSIAFRESVHFKLEETNDD